MLALPACFLNLGGAQSPNSSAVILPVQLHTNIICQIVEKSLNNLAIRLWSLILISNNDCFFWGGKKLGKRCHNVCLHIMFATIKLMCNTHGEKLQKCNKLVQKSPKCKDNAAPLANKSFFLILLIFLLVIYTFVRRERPLCNSLNYEIMHLPSPPLFDLPLFYLLPHYATR